MDEHQVTAEVASKANECPFFTQKGCPYAHHTPIDVSALKSHPAFAQGCPYKGADVHKLKDCPAFKDHKCPFDGSHPIDISKINQCPAFKEGCPYKSHKHEKHDHDNMNEHTATEHIATEATKCPMFSHSNCPFDPSHPHSFDLSKATLCPAFQRSGGCPFKGVHVEKLKECPAFKDGKCPFNGTHAVDLTRVKECPAFQKGCPYSHLHDFVGAGARDSHSFIFHLGQEAHQCPFFAKEHGGCPYDPNHLRSFDLSKAKDCPKFKKDGNFECPYKNVKINRLDECPAFKAGKCPFDGSAAIDLSKLKDCPSFKAGCPFKTAAAPNANQNAPVSTTTTTTQTSSAATPTATPAALPAGHPAVAGSQGAATCPFSAMHKK